MTLVISLSDQIEETEVVSIYRSNDWSSAGKPVELLAALRNSHGLVTAQIEGKLVGLGNAISDALAGSINAINMAPARAAQLKR